MHDVTHVGPGMSESVNLKTGNRIPPLGAFFQILFCEYCIFACLFACVSLLEYKYSFMKSCDDVACACVLYISICQVEEQFELLVHELELTPDDHATRMKICQQLETLLNSKINGLCPVLDLWLNLLCCFLTRCQRRRLECFLSCIQCVRCSLLLPMCGVCLSVCLFIRQSVCDVAEFGGTCCVCGVICCSLCQITLVYCLVFCLS